MKKIKVLEVVPSLSQANGISSFCVSYLKHIDLQKFNIDFMVINNVNKDYNGTLEKLGCRIFDMGFGLSKKGLPKKIKEFFKNNTYDIVHCHAPNFGLFVQYYAKKYNVKVRILHSHATVSSGKTLNKLRNSLIEPIAVKLSTHYLACSNEAGKALFKKKKFNIVNNALYGDDFIFNQSARQEIRNKYGVKDEEILLGNVGRISNEKNQEFLVEILSLLDDKYKLILVGDGPRMGELKKLVEQKKLSKKVIIAGVQSNVKDFYSAMDMFLLPSLFEGLGLALIEAQMMGLRCFASKDRVPEIANFSGSVTYLKIEDGAKVWAESIKRIDDVERLDVKEKFLESNFNILKEVKVLEDYYIDFMR